MKTGMNLLLWASLVTEEHFPVLDQLKEIGFDAVEIPIFDVSDLKPYEQLGRRIKALGFGATAVTVMSPETNPISPLKEVREAAVNYLDRVLECGQAFGNEILCGPLHSALGAFSGAGATAEEFKAGVETMQEAGERAKARGQRLALECLNRFECYFLNTAAQGVKFVEAVDHPSVKLMYDSFHANIEEKNQAQAFATAAKHVIHVHVSENDRGTPGTGGVNWDSFWSGLTTHGYNGYTTIEAFGRALPALAAATRVWRDLFPDAMGLCREGHAFMKSHHKR
jgi:D-psicose/D-tagatose/L-ribulose 3-epimerase